MSDPDPQACRATAMNLLARREHSSKELRQKLISRHYDVPVVDQALASLIQERLLSDERFAESYVQYRSNNGFGPVRLRQELRERGIEDELIGHNLEGLEWQQLAAATRQKKFGAVMPEDYQARAKQMRFLQYRGFTTDQIHRVLKSIDWE
jgi:regulatory protein